MNLSNLLELNQIYNFQDTIILCEIFEQQSEMLKNIFEFNPRKCNSASSFSGYVNRNKNKCCIAFPTDAGHVRAFEKTLIGGFSCVNTSLAFDINMLLNNADKEKVLVELEINEKKTTKCISSKILKMDENNQYGMAMTKPLPYGCIKKQNEVPTLTEFNKILDSLSPDDNIGHLFTAHIKFHDVNKKALLFNEIYPPIFLISHIIQKRIRPLKTKNVFFFMLKIRIF